MKQHLEDLRACREGYLVVAFGDAASQLVLRASHEKTHRREYLDQLCARAAECFRMLDATVVLKRNATAPNEALLHAAGTTTIFARQDPSASDFLCIVCDRSVALKTLSSDAHDTLKLIAA